MTIISFCASTVFLNVIILYLYFSNWVLIVLYVCYNGVLFLRCIVCYNCSSRKLLHCKFSGNVWSLCDLLDWNLRGFAVELEQSIPCFFVLFGLFFAVSEHLFRTVWNRGTPAVRLNIWMREFQLIYSAFLFIDVLQLNHKYKTEIEYAFIHENV